ncbi:MAG: ferredoxin [Candidatus Omnitrophica bacterium]|nr:ferredoxin [Candidatus Omnitrophota bacterium]
MKAKVDQNECAGSEECVRICPQVFEMRGKTSHVYVDEVPKEAEGQCRLARDRCPVSAITIEE